MVVEIAAMVRLQKETPARSNEYTNDKGADKENTN